MLIGLLQKNGKKTDRSLLADKDLLFFDEDFSKVTFYANKITIISVDLDKISPFYLWVFFYEHLRVTGQLGKGESIYLSLLYHFHPLHRHLDINRSIIAESSLLQIAYIRTRTGNFCFPSASR